MQYLGSHLLTNSLNPSLSTTENGLISLAMKTTMHAAMFLASRVANWLVSEVWPFSNFLTQSVLTRASHYGAVLNVASCWLRYSSHLLFEMEWSIFTFKNVHLLSPSSLRHDTATVTIDVERKTRKVKSRQHALPFSKSITIHFSIITYFYRKFTLVKYLFIPNTHTWSKKYYGQISA